MEITAYPINWGIQAAKVTTPQGDIDVIRVNVQDAGPTLVGPQGQVQLPGTMFTLVFTLEAWESFQRTVADPEGEAVKAQARSKIVLAPNGMANRLRPKQ